MEKNWQKDADVKHGRGPPPIDGARQKDHRDDQQRRGKERREYQHPYPGSPGEDVAPVLPFPQAESTEDRRSAQSPQGPHEPAQKREQGRGDPEARRAKSLSQDNQRKGARDRQGDAGRHENHRKPYLLHARRVEGQIQPFGILGRLATSLATQRSEDSRVCGARRQTRDPKGPRSAMMWLIDHQLNHPYQDTRMLIFPRQRGQGDYAARAAVWDLNSNSMGLTTQVRADLRSFYMQQLWWPARRVASAGQRPYDHVNARTFQVTDFGITRRALSSEASPVEARGRRVERARARIEAIGWSGEKVGVM
jgi:hypothetical protein